MRITAALTAACTALTLACPAAPLTLTPALAEGPMIAVLQYVPDDVAGEIYLVDIAASARQFAGLDADPGLKALLPFKTLPVPRGFYTGVLEYFPDGYREALGISVAEIGQMAGWAGLPEVQLVMRIPDLDRHLAAIAAALGNRGYATTKVRSVPVWHILDDLKMERDLIAADPFLGYLGTSVRLAAHGDMLVFAKTWPGIRALLASRPNLIGPREARVLIRTAYAIQGRGELVGMVYLGAQRPVIDPEKHLGSAATRAAVDELKRQIGMARRVGLPGYAQHALALWQDGTHFTAAIMIPYPDQAMARRAQQILDEKLAVTRSLVNGQNLAEILSSKPETELFRAGTAWALVASFPRQMVPHDGKIDLGSFLRTPLATLLHMHETRDLPLLIGSAVD